MPPNGNSKMMQRRRRDRASAKAATKTQNLSTPQLRLKAQQAIKDPKSFGWEFGSPEGTEIVDPTSGEVVWEKGDDTWTVDALEKAQKKTPAMTDVFK